MSGQKDGRLAVYLDEDRAQNLTTKLRKEALLLPKCNCLAYDAAKRTVLVDRLVTELTRHIMDCRYLSRDAGRTNERHKAEGAAKVRIALLLTQQVSDGEMRDK